MTSDETMNLDAMMDGSRDGHTGDLAVIPPDVDEAWLAKLADDSDDDSADEGHPAITLPPVLPDPGPPMSDDERARLYLWHRWSAAYLGTHHLPDWADPFWAQRFGQFLRAFTTVLVHRDSGDPADDAAVTSRAAVMLAAQPGAPEAEQAIGVRLAPTRHLGHKVRCGGCDRYYRYTVEEPYYGTHRRTGGRCYACLLGPGAAAAGDGRDVLSIYDQILAERGA